MEIPSTGYSKITSLSNRKASHQILRTIGSFQLERKTSFETPLLKVDQNDDLRQKLFEKKLSTLENIDGKFKAYVQDSKEEAYFSPKTKPFSIQTEPNQKLNFKNWNMKTSSSSILIDRKSQPRQIVKSQIVNLKDHYPEHVTVTPQHPVQLRLSAVDKQFPVKVKFYEYSSNPLKIYWSYNYMPTTLSHEGYQFMPKTFIIEGKPDITWIGFLLVLDEGIYHHFIGCSFKADKPLILPQGWKKSNVVYGVSEKITGKSNKWDDNEFSESGRGTQRATVGELTDIELFIPERKLF